MEGEEKTVSVDVDEAFIIKSDAGDLCRLCANTDNQLIPIFKGEGIEHNIPTKIEKHLPIIKVTEIDKLPLQICYQCASTLIAWHNLYEGCLIADKRLREILSISEKGFQEDDTFDNYVDDYRDDYDDQSRSNFDTLPLNSAPSTSNLAGDDLLKSNSIEISQLSESKEPNETELDNTDERCKRSVAKKRTSVKSRPSLLAKAVRVSASKARDEATKESPIASLKVENDDTKIGDDVAKRSKRKGYPCSNKTCPTCGKTFTRSNGCKRHVESRICIRSRKCAKCGLRCASYAMLCKHVVSCEGELSNIVIRKSETSAGHVTSSSAVKQFPRCVTCSKTFRTMYSVNRHIKRVHRYDEANEKLERKKNLHFEHLNVTEDGKEILKCDQCGYATPFKHRFEQHYRIHTGERPFLCFHCGKSFRTKGYVLRHILVVHEGVKKFSCDICGRSFSDRRFMESHRYIHTGERPYVCDICGKTYRQSATLLVHKRFHLNVRDYECEVCQKKFVRRGHLLMHLKRHNNIKDFACSQCGKAFVDRKMLKDHEVVHSNERPFICDLCGAGFKLRKHLKQHDRTHRAK